MMFQNQPRNVKVEDGLELITERRMGSTLFSPYYYLVDKRGSWQDWVNLAEEIIIAEAKRKESL